ASSSIEEVTQERGEPVWSQLYAGTHWPSTLKMIKRAENTGSPVLVLTVDLIGSGNRETLQRFIKRDTRDCAACHGEVRSPFRGRPMFDGINLDDYFAGEQAIDWTLVDKIKEATNMKLVIKGITHSDDALNCLKHGVDGIVVSNHGGRGQVSARATIDVLPEVAKVVNKRIPVLVDGGIRRGADVYKALALGADAVDIGRPTLWGLSAFGSDGVEKVLDILNAELVSVMQQMAVTSIDEISANSLTMK
ncbi:MAG: alpha-hydroxy acid oxidase, partial [Emcibacteraceae bacterium]|nr:alpha-hydroxy acid oxidase [Emcibacteraceae bacterium]